MKTRTTNSILLSAIFGLSFGLVSASAVYAADNEIILDQAIHDYGENYADTSNTLASRDYGKRDYSRIGYRAVIVLDESYQDYTDEGASAFSGNEGVTEQAEFAAFDASKASSEIPWELSVVD